MAETKEQIHDEAVSEIKEQVAGGVVASPLTWATQIARLGYVANGIVYMLVGLLALDASLGVRSPEVSREDALRAIVYEPFGRVILVIIAVGLVGYSLGHILMAARPPEKDDKEGLASIVNRVAHAVNGLLHLGLALVAAQLGFGLGPTTSDGRTPADWTRELLSVRYGQALVVGVGAGFVGLALYQLYRAYTARFRKALAPGEISRDQDRWLTWTGRIGYTVRAIIYALMGIFLVRAAITFNPEEARGLGQTLAVIANQDYGLYLLGAVAVGLIAFGVYVILMGRYRDFRL